MQGQLSSLVIQAIEELGTKNIDGVTESKIKALLDKEDTKQLQKNLALVPARIHDYILTLLNKTT